MLGHHLSRAAEELQPFDDTQWFCGRCCASPCQATERGHGGLPAPTPGKAPSRSGCLRPLPEVGWWVGAALWWASGTGLGRCCGGFRRVAAAGCSFSGYRKDPADCCCAAGCPRNPFRAPCRVRGLPFLLGWCRASGLYRWIGDVNSNNLQADGGGQIDTVNCSHRYAVSHSHVIEPWSSSCDDDRP